MNINRRSFLKQGSSIAATAASPWLLNLAAIGEASAQSAQDYKALVCIFLTGGNDQSNTLVPMPQYHYDRYVQQRPTFCLQRYALLHGDGLGVTTKPVTQAPIPKNVGYPGLDDFPDLKPAGDLMLETMSSAVPNAAAYNWYGLAPSLSALHPLYQEGVLATVLNVGPLIEPTVGHGLDAAGAVKLVKHADITQPAQVPAKIGSHNDQQMYWQSLRTEGAQQGWGGLMLSFINPANAYHEVESVFTSGTPIWSQGVGTTTPYSANLGESLVTPFDAFDGLYGGTNVSSTIQSIMSGYPGTFVGQRDYNRLNKLRRDLMEISENAFSLRSQLGSSVYDRLPDDPVYAALTALAEAETPFTPLKNRLAPQLRAVAHAIRVTRQMSIAPRRQVFFVTLDGFDTHSGTAEMHDPLLQHLAQAMLAFQRTLEHPSIDLADQVTTFTASDFGRTLSGNGDGSDHGWGGHHFVMGGSVKGGSVFGVPPQLGDKAKSLMLLSGNSPATNVYGYTDTGRGRLIPTISVDQYGATLARWMGVSDADMPSIFKNINNFDMSAHPSTRVRSAWSKYLDFMQV